MFKLSDDWHVNVHASSTDNLRLGVYRLITHFNLEAKHPFGFFSYKKLTSVASEWYGTLLPKRTYLAR